MTAWIVAAVAVWLALAVLTALVLGRMIRLRDRQRPLPGARDVTVPEQRRAPAAESSDPVQNRVMEP